MAISNHDRVGKALDLLREGLRPFVEREMKAQHAQRWFEEAKASVSDSQAHVFGTEEEPRWDIDATVAVMWNQWNDVFRKTLGHAERSLATRERGGGVRDRAAAAVRAAGGTGAVRGAGVLRPLPDSASGVPARVPRLGL